MHGPTTSERLRRALWNAIAEDWNFTMFFPSRAGDGLEEFEMDQIIHTIAHTL